MAEVVELSVVGSGCDFEAIANEVGTWVEVTAGVISELIPPLCLDTTLLAAEGLDLSAAAACT